MNFKQAVNAYISSGESQVEDKVKALAAACKVAPYTVNRWASGKATPGQNVQNFILAKIAELSNVKKD